jgi:hypothetical protein
MKRFTGNRAESSSVAIPAMRLPTTKVDANPAAPMLMGHTVPTTKIATSTSNEMLAVDMGIPYFFVGMRTRFV